jgi:hypothetical protein
VCNPGKIASLLIPASVLLVLAIFLFTSVIAASSSWWTSASGVVLMLSAAAALTACYVLVNLAANEAAKCTSEPCKTFGDRLFVALIALSVTIAVLAVAAVVAAFPAGFPWAGGAIGAFFAAAATAAAITLFYISASVLPTLDTCRAAGVGPSTPVAVQQGVGTIAAILILTGGAAIVAKVFGG